ncbi:hypothetical protein MAPG_08795 [Magnaporthiopsis poae ATCC 64411]|uniref:Heterokaryon incompatibility domain-containing protein n=1 Tax=Magnaporthiopsis poae (strain ATCC 64411 / 73-15) TaxID=644358 RepID=A0A0C4E898_MAGP6|nr:hypothetical protein MAPG_08795 [Magnaporthiopsis poae ATCC 64411]
MPDAPVMSTFLIPSEAMASMLVYDEEMEGPVKRKDLPERPGTTRTHNAPIAAVQKGKLQDRESTTAAAAPPDFLPMAAASENGDLDTCEDQHDDISDDPFEGCAICGLPRDGDDGTWLEMLGFDVDFPALLRSRGDGCWGCCLIADAISAVRPNHSHFTKTREMFATIYRGDAGGLQVSFGAKDRGIISPLPPTHFEIFGLEGTANPFSSLATVEEIIPDTRDARVCGAKISAWLDKCLGPNSWHTSSCRGTNPSFTPRRLVDVRRTNDPDVHLVELGALSEQIAYPLCYVALSYCWGPDTTGIVKTLTDNIDQHRRGISVSTLPKTLQDAIAVCRSIEARYIWIDALCIIQNDLSDWETESIKMLDIYSNSHLTIAVHPARSCKDGFLGGQLFGRATWQMKFHTMNPENNTPTSSFPMALRQRLAREDGPLVQCPEDDASFRTPLLERGWTFQEAIMPRRIVHFTTRELIWECGSAHWCECGHVEHLDRYRMPGPAHELLVKTNTETSRTGQILDNPGQVWINTLRSYGRRSFTSPSDRLIALSGVAKIMVQELIKVAFPFQKETLASVYLAGIYRTPIPRHLLWETDWINTTAGNAARPTTEDRTNPYLAPSWSWASVKHMTTYLMGQWQETSHVELVGAFCKPKQAGGDPTGNIAYGELQLRGLVVPVVLSSWPSSSFPRTGNAGSSKWTGGFAVVRRRPGQPRSIVRAPNGCKVEVLCDVEQAVSVSDPDSELCACWGSNWCWSCAEGIDWENPEFCCMKVATHVSEAARGRWSIRGHLLVFRQSKAVQGAWERVALGTLDTNPPTSWVSGQNLEDMKRDFERDEWVLFRGGEIKTLRLV